jgi:hypothetical protein
MSSWVSRGSQSRWRSIVDSPQSKEITEESADREGRAIERMGTGLAK